MMLKLEPPNVDAKEFFELCVENSRPLEKRARLQSSANCVDLSSEDYRAKAVQKKLYEYSRIGDSDASDDELYKVYDSARSQEGPRTVLDQILFAAPNKRCTLCWHREAEELDHFLPRGNHQELSVTPSNLVPSCRRCNSRSGKGTHTPIKYEEQFIHPYFDDFTGTRWLIGNALEAEGETTVKFDIIVPHDWDPSILERLHFHFEELGLWQLYESNAAQEMKNIADIIDSAKLTTYQAIKSFLDEQALKMEKKAHNTWKTATYFALAESDLFIESLAT